MTIITYFSQTHDKIFVFAFTSSLALAGVFFVKILKIKKIADKRLEVFSDCFHKLTDLIRNEFYNIKIQSDKGILTLDYLLEKLKNASQTAVNVFANCLTVSTGVDVCATIKYFNTGNPDPHVVTNDMEVITLCRSDNQPKKRLDNNSPSKIIDNTDFLTIVKYDLPHFCTSNLEKHSKRMKETTGFPYKNSNVNWSDYYLSTIVIPIRIKRKYVDRAYSGEAHDIMGFLCVDSKSTSAFRDSDIDNYVNLVKAFADSLYKFFDRFLYYQKSLTRE